MSQLYFNVISYRVIYDNVLTKYRTALGTFGIPPTLLQTDRKSYRKEITFIPRESIDKNIKRASRNQRPIVQSKYGNSITAVIEIYGPKGRNFIKRVSLYKY